MRDVSELARHDIDGVVIATPSALHADQTIAALEGGHAVFCQKPLGRSAAEVSRVVAAARRANRLLGVDVSYRGLEEARVIRDLVRSGELGDVFSAELVFHNAYGPEGGWFREYGLAGGGCVIDLGVHLVDLCASVLGWPLVARARGMRWAEGRALAPRDAVCEDFAIGEIVFANGPTARLACSWNLSEGVDARISMTLYGTRASARLENIDGSFTSFRALRMEGTREEVLSETREDFDDWRWGGRVAVAWAKQLAEDGAFDPSAHRFVEVAEVVDAIYGRSSIEEPSTAKVQPRNVNGAAV